MRQKSKAEMIVECYRLAAQARHMAETATNPFERADLLEVGERSLSLARSPELWRGQELPAIRVGRRAGLIQPLNSSTPSPSPVRDVFFRRHRDPFAV
jgi:hypothetical protein